MGMEEQESYSYYNGIKRYKYMEKGSERHEGKLKRNACEEELGKQAKLVASLEREIEYKDGQILKMQQNYHETIARFREVGSGLTEKIYIKDKEMEEMEHKHQCRVNMLMAEAAKLSGVHLTENRKMQSQNWELKSVLAWKSTLLETCKTQKHLECKRVEKEIKELKEELRNQNATAIDKKNLESQITLLRTELEEKSKALQSLESLNNALVLKELESRQELQEAREAISLRKDLEEKTDYLESLNSALIIQELISRRELQEARSESILSLKDVLNNRTTLVIKRLGEIDRKVFEKACLQKFPNGDWGDISAKLCSSWEEYLRGANWHPFKTINIKGKLDEIVDEDDEKLKELRNNYGEEVYMAVANALLEMNEHYPSGRYLVSEIWNSKEGRLATMKEIIQYLVKQVKTLKRKR